MSFNNGFLCPTCGPIQSAKKKTINKIQFDVCPVCTSVVKKWTRPLNERAGRCANCSGGSFKLAMKDGHLLRCCKRCNEVVDTDLDCKIIRKGDKKHEYSRDN